jgi:hypothetical protein
MKSIITIVALLIALNCYCKPKENNSSNQLSKLSNKIFSINTCKYISFAGVVTGTIFIIDGIDKNSKKQINIGQLFLIPSFTISISLDILTNNKKNHGKT